MVAANAVARDTLPGAPGGGVGSTSDAVYGPGVGVGAPGPAWGLALVRAAEREVSWCVPPATYGSRASVAAKPVGGE